MKITATTEVKKTIKISTYMHTYIHKYFNDSTSIYYVKTANNNPLPSIYCNNHFFNFHFSYLIRGRR